MSSADLEARYRSRSLWLDQVCESLAPRPALASDLDVDVAIVGAGYTGLWTAYYLLRANPHLRVAVLEKEIAGFGASGRNGGWCSALFAGNRDAIARTHGPGAVVALQRALFDTVDEVGMVTAREQIGADYRKGGTLTFARSAAQQTRIQAAIAAEHASGLGSEDLRWLDRSEARRRLSADGVLGASYTPHCARVQPAKLARGLATTVERLGGAVYEQTPALALGPRRVETPGGRVRAEIVVRATEGYTAGLPGMQRVLAPVYSLMIATEPLPSEFWHEVGWGDRETVTDARHVVIYAQRTADDRVAFGGRGAPYHYGSRISDAFDRDPRTFGWLTRALTELFPSLAAARITHRWGGPLGVPRDWKSAVGLDRDAGLAWAGGYVGDGVGVSNLAGRTLADLVLERDTELVRLPWVGHRWRPWEREPLRWLGITLAVAIPAAADRVETRTGRPARLHTALLDRLLGGR